MVPFKTGEIGAHSVRIIKINYFKKQNKGEMSVTGIANNSSRMIVWNPFEMEWTLGSLVSVSELIFTVCSLQRKRV